MEMNTWRKPDQPNPDIQGLEIFEGDREITLRLRVPEVEAEIPGVTAKDIEITIDGRRMALKGEKALMQMDEKGTPHLAEGSYCFLEEDIQLPADVDPRKIDSDYEGGVLTIRLKKEAI